jgi:transcriptional regulator with XRE-family HTH domain
MNDLSEGDEGEVQRLADLLSMLIKVSGRSRRSIEEELGLGSSGLSKILGGTVRLQVSHVLSILRVLQVDPADFYRMAYPRRRLRQSAILEEARALLRQDPAEEEALEEMPDFEERVRRVLLRMLSGRPQGAN